MPHHAVRVSSKHQIVIPKEVRNALDLKSGDTLLVSVDGDRIVMRIKPKSYAKRLLGLHKEVWEGIEPTEYTRRERASWEP